MEEKSLIRKRVQEGKTALGIEVGSTRIKAVLIDSEYKPIAAGSHEWENKLENGMWTYSLEDIWRGIQEAYQNLTADLAEKYGIIPEKIGSIGFSGMMHGYLAFDKDGKLLAPFRTWRNTNTQRASDILCQLFDYNIPQRWSIAHLYQAILDGEEHVKDICFMTTLSGYIHWRLTGEKVLGIGDCSGMFPIDSKTKDYNEDMLQAFDALIGGKHFPWKLRDILPKVLPAGEPAGILTEEGARRLDVSGHLKAGIPICPPEGDAGTGMVATNSVKMRTGNVSAGTSVFMMAVLEQPLSKPYPGLDMVTTPEGNLVAMVHCNNCTSDLDAWVNIFQEFTELIDIYIDPDVLYGILYRSALDGDKDCGGLVSYCYYSGEPMTGFREGRPLFVRTPNSKFTLPNFMRMHLYTSLAALKMGLDILFKQEHVELDVFMGHGGFFKTKGVGQSIMAAAVNVPVTVMETAGEGGAWGIALLASYMASREENESLADYLDHKVFVNQEGTCMKPNPKDVLGFERFMQHYEKAIPTEQAAVDTMRY